MIDKTQEKSSNSRAASPELLAEAFHNPYTFIPFPKMVKRYEHTPMTIDDDPEQMDYRLTGVLELDVQTLSPLMTCSPNPIDAHAEHKHYPALTIGSDVVLPATGVRGSLRTLMTILSGGSLGYLDENLWLPKTNDVRLGPNEKDSDVPDHVFLARVERAGNSKQPGIIELGDTHLLTVDEIEKKLKKAGQLKGKKLEDFRPTNGRKKVLKIEGCLLKLSGRPVKTKGRKKEGLFEGNGTMLEIPEHYWAEYQGKHRHAVVEALKKGDLIWLEPYDVNLKENGIRSVEDIKSFQWSRWGRGGRKLRDALPTNTLIPDSHLNNARVDWVTDLFGHIPHSKATNSPAAFAARIRPGNLIFYDAANKVITETLAPMGAPHPSCAAFYNDAENLDEVDSNNKLRGYKVYRNTSERGQNAPWKFSVQGGYDESGKLQPNQKQKMKKTVELLNEGMTGKLRISFRSLDADDLALLYAACTVDWKLGGGKPLGLGHCRVISATIITEDGERLSPLETNETTSQLMLADDHIDSLKLRVDDFAQRYALYQTAQIPVEKLRYPRAVEKNNNKNSRAGVAWFSRHATLKKNGRGLETIWTDGELKQQCKNTQIRAQALPQLVKDDHMADVLYGYDLINSKSTTKNQRKMVEKLEPFDESEHISGREKSDQNMSQSAKTRQQARDERKADD